MKFILYIALFLSTILQALAYEHETMDTVISYHWGEGQNTGQSKEYFPQNIFGKPDSTASETSPASSPEEICSLGLDGTITVAFKEYEIVDGPGADFTIFENAFINPVTNKIFVEPAVVSVSYDGVNFFAFPFDSLTLKGCAGITPTHGEKDCFNPAESGGDSFDLAKIGLKRIRYIRIKDISKMLLENPHHPFYDPIITGFDLDAVCGLNLEKVKTSVANNKIDAEIKISTTNRILTLNSNIDKAKISVIDMSGKTVVRKSFSYFAQIDNLISGVYIIFISKNNKIIFRKKVLI